MTTSAERLATALEELHDERLGDVIAKARQGYYDDFHSPLMFPRAALVEELIRLRLLNLVQRALNGDFHATVDDAIAWRKRMDGKNDRTW